MPQQDHDQRFKILIRETIRQFFELFLAKYVHLFDFEGATLSALMRVPSDRKAEHKAAALWKVIESGENDYRKHLYAECIQACLPLTEERERDEFERLNADGD